MIVAVAPWSLAYQHPYDGSSFLIDFATFIILLAAEFLRVGKKNRTTWIYAIMLAFPYGSLLATLGLTKPLIHIIWIIKIPRIVKILSNLNFLTTHSSLHKKFDLIYTLTIIATFIHSFACIWITLTGHEGDVITLYNRAVYWTVTTVATVGYGDITPTTNPSRIFAIIVMLFGVGFYGFIVSKISTFLFQKDRRTEAKTEKMEHLSAFLNHYKVPASLRNEVFDFYEHRLQAMMNDEEERILGELPPGLKGEVQIYLNIAPLSRTELFRNCSEACLRDASLNLARRIVNPNEQVIKQGDIGREMYIIGHGKVRVSIQGQVIASLGKSQSFGEAALIKEEPRSADVIAETYCDLYILTKEIFEKLLVSHSDLRSNVEKKLLEMKK
jgi:voltage-gated potassium channel